MEKVNTSTIRTIKYLYKTCTYHILPPTYKHIGKSYTDSLLRNKKLMFDEIVFKFFYIFGIRKPCLEACLVFDFENLFMST